jgi:hypothetical protein
MFQGVTILVLATTVILLGIGVGLLRHRIQPLEAELLPRACRECGCTDDEACWPSGCHWVEDDLCSACLPGNPTGQGV